MKLITDIMRDIRKGRAVEDASYELNEVVKAVTATRKPGSVTITFNVKPQKDDQGQVIIATDIKSKRPKAGVPDAIFFADADGDLHRSDPTQRDMFDPEERPAPARRDVQ